MSAIWYEFGCPVCDKTNWVCDGDPSDMSGMDIEAVECAYCRTIFDTSEGIIQDPSEVVAEKGQKVAG